MIRNLHSCHGKRRRQILEMSCRNKSDGSKPDIKVSNEEVLKKRSSRRQILATIKKRSSLIERFLRHNNLFLTHRRPNSGKTQ